MTRRQFSRRAALCAALGWATHGAHAQWSLEFELGRTHESNLPNAQSEADIVSDSAWLASASLVRPLYVDANATLALSLDARTAQYDHYSGVSFTSLGGALSWRRKLGLGLAVPRLEAKVSWAREAYRDSARNGDRSSLELAAGHRFSEALDARLGVRRDWRATRDDLPVVPGISGKPYDLQGTSLFARGSYAPTERLLLSAGYAERRGDVVASTRRNLAIFRASDAIAADPAFGPDYFAYRLTGARTQTLSFGASWALGESSSVDLSFSSDRSRTREGLAYDGNAVGLHYVHRLQ